jgi:GxxExxY protein
MVKEFNSRQIEHQREVKFNVIYKGQTLPHFFIADFLTHKKVLIEVKAVSNIREEHIAQALNYLKVSKLKTGIIINFGPQGIERWIQLTNATSDFPSMISI